MKTGLESAKSVTDSQAIMRYGKKAEATVTSTEDVMRPDML